MEIFFPIFSKFFIEILFEMNIFVGHIFVEKLSFVKKPRMASTWFFISAISGEITIAVPSNNNAGNWYVIDLPTPVGIITNVSWPSKTLWIILSWSPLKLSKPKYRFSFDDNLDFVGAQPGDEVIISRHAGFSYEGLQFIKYDDIVAILTKE